MAQLACGQQLPNSFGNITKMSAQPTHPPEASEARTREDVRAKLLVAAMQVLRNEGIHALTQAHVAQAAGVRQSHLTYYFPSRNALLAAIVDEGGEATVCCMGRSDAAELPATVQEYLEQIAAQISETSVSRIMMALAQSSEEDASLKIWMADFRRRVIERLRLSLLHYGVVPTAEQLGMFHALLVGLSVINLSEATPASAEQARQLCLLAGAQLVARAPHRAAPGPDSPTQQPTKAGA